MLKMNVIQAAQHFGISKEAIHNRIRRGSLESVVEDGIKYVIVDENAPQTKTQTKKVQPSDDKYYKLLEEQNQQLQQKIETLELETRSLRDQKEQMLIDERKMIEQIYKEKDEQLKNILNAFQAQLALDVPKEIEQKELLEAEIEHIEEDNSEMISLKKYIKKNNISEKKAKKLKTKLKKLAKNDSRIILKDKKIYFDFQKYDYNDLGIFS